MAKEQYHHGELRTALLDAAERALNDDPNRALSIRSLASELGVSATAPHAHFKNKADLLAALATRGFAKLRIETIAGHDTSAPHADRIEHLAQAYLRFSARNVGLYKLMFTTGVTLEDYPDLFQASRASYGVLQDALRDMHPEETAEQTDKRALAAWAIVHGMSALLSEQRIPADIISDRSIDGLARLISQTLVDAE